MCRQENEGLRKEVARLGEENSTLKGQVDVAKRDAVQQAGQFAAKERQSEDRVRQLEDRVVALSQQSESTDKSLVQAGKAMSSQVEKLGLELAESRRENEELRRSQQQMEASLTNLIIQERRLRSENDEQMEFIAQARNTIAQLRSEGNIEAPPLRLSFAEEFCCQRHGGEAKQRTREFTFS